jgi:hypothetical protein
MANKSSRSTSVAAFISAFVLLSAPLATQASAGSLAEQMEELNNALVVPQLLESSPPETAVVAAPAPQLVIRAREPWEIDREIAAEQNAILQAGWQLFFEAGGVQPVAVYKWEDDPPDWKLEELRDHFARLCDLWQEKEELTHGRENARKRYEQLANNLRIGRSGPYHVYSSQSTATTDIYPQTETPTQENESHDYLTGVKVPTDAGFNADGTPHVQYGWQVIRQLKQD